MIYKQVIVIRSDLNMSTGKCVAQGAHVSLLSALKVQELNLDLFLKWMSKEEGFRKIVLEVKSLEKLLKIKEEVEKENIPCAIVEDYGLTELTPGTITALGIGPDLETKINPITKKLSLFK